NRTYLLIITSFLGKLKFEIKIKRSKNKFNYLTCHKTYFYSQKNLIGFNKNVTQKKPRPNNGQCGRPSRPVCGSEPTDLGELDGRPRRPRRPKRPRRPARSPRSAG
ncbi:hypothetical protein BpHYR1_017367, partial [Brachionus plicatilis]